MCGVLLEKLGASKRKKDRKKKQQPLPFLGVFQLQPEIKSYYNNTNVCTRK